MYSNITFKIAVLLIFLPNVIAKLTLLCMVLFYPNHKTDNHIKQSMKYTNFKRRASKFFKKYYFGKERSFSRICFSTTVYNQINFSVFIYAFSRFTKKTFLHIIIT